MSYNYVKVELDKATNEEILNNISDDILKNLNPAVFDKKQIEKDLLSIKDSREAYCIFSTSEYKHQRSKILEDYYKRFEVIKTEEFDDINMSGFSCVSCSEYENNSYLYILYNSFDFEDVINHIMRDDFDSKRYLKNTTRIVGGKTLHELVKELNELAEDLKEII